MQHYRSKVFFIGFNKTATTSFHRLFKDSGYLSYHNLKRTNGKVNIAKIIDENYCNNKPLLQTIELADCYSDMIYSTNSNYIEANKYFNLFKIQYPGSYFILQTRNEDDWIKSRLNHRHKPPFLERCKLALGIKSTDEVIDYWRNLRRNHHINVKKYFNDYEKFIEFNIDTDDINKLIDFLSDDYSLDKKYWTKHNKTIMQWQGLNK